MRCDADAETDGDRGEARDYRILFAPLFCRVRCVAVGVGDGDGGGGGGGGGWNILQAGKARVGPGRTRWINVDY